MTNDKKDDIISLTTLKYSSLRGEDASVIASPDRRSGRSNLFTKIVAWLVIICFSVTNITYGYERSDTAHLRDVVARESRSKIKAVERLISNGKPGDDKLTKVSDIDRYYDAGVNSETITFRKDTVRGSRFFASHSADITDTAGAFLKNGKGRVLDLGSGNAKAVAIFSLYAEYVKGIEIDSQLHEEGLRCVKDLGRDSTIEPRKIALENKDFFEEDFSTYDLIYIYWPFVKKEVSDEQKIELEKKLTGELKPGAIFVVNWIGTLNPGFFSRLEEIDLLKMDFMHLSIAAYKKKSMVSPRNAILGVVLSGAVMGKIVEGVLRAFGIMPHTASGVQIAGFGIVAGILALAITVVGIGIWYFYTKLKQKEETARQKIVWQEKNTNVRAVVKAFTPEKIEELKGLLNGESKKTVHKIFNEIWEIYNVVAEEKDNELNKRFKRLKIYLDAERSRLIRLLRRLRELKTTKKEFEDILKGLVIELGKDIDSKEDIPPATILPLQKLFGKNMSFREYSINRAPVIEQLIFRAAPLFVASLCHVLLNIPLSAADYASIIRCASIIFILLHLINDRAPPEDSLIKSLLSPVSLVFLLDILLPYLGFSIFSVVIISIPLHSLLNTMVFALRDAGLSISSATIGKMPQAECSPFNIYSILLNNFRWQFVSPREIRQKTKRRKGGHLSINTVKRLLTFLKDLGFVSVNTTNRQKRYKAIIKNQQELAILQGLGAMPDSVKIKRAKDRLAALSQSRRPNVIEEESQKLIFFIGASRQRVDKENNRLFIPDKFLKNIPTDPDGKRRVIISAPPGRARRILTLFHEETWPAFYNKILERLRALTKKGVLTEDEGRAYKKLFLAKSEGGVIGNNMIVLAPTFLKYLGIKNTRDVTIVGMGDHLAIWNSKDFNEIKRDIKLQQIPTIERRRRTLFRGIFEPSIDKKNKFYLPIEFRSNVPPDATLIGTRVIFGGHKALVISLPRDWKRLKSFLLKDASDFYEALGVSFNASSEPMKLDSMCRLSLTFAVEWLDIKDTQHIVLTGTGNYILIQNKEVHEKSPRDGFIRQGEESFKKMVENIKNHLFTYIDMGYYDSFSKQSFNAMLVNTVVSSDNDFCFGFNSHAPPVKKELTHLLGTDTFNNLFPSPTLVLGRDMFWHHIEPSIKKEFLYHEANCSQTNHYETIFKQQKLYPENYSDGDFVLDEATGLKYLPGHKGDPTKPFKGKLGKSIREIIDIYNLIYQLQYTEYAEEVRKRLVQMGPKVIYCLKSAYRTTELESLKYQIAVTVGEFREEIFPNIILADSAEFLCNIISNRNEPIDVRISAIAILESALKEIVSIEKFKEGLAAISGLSASDIDGSIYALVDALEEREPTIWDIKGRGENSKIATHIKDYLEIATSSSRVIIQTLLNAAMSEEMGLSERACYTLTNMILDKDGLSSSRDLKAQIAKALRDYSDRNGVRSCQGINIYQLLLALLETRLASSEDEETEIKEHCIKPFLAAVWWSFDRGLILELWRQVVSIFFSDRRESQPIGRLNFKLDLLKILGAVPKDLRKDKGLIAGLLGITDEIIKKDNSPIIKMKANEVKERFEKIAQENSPKGPRGDTGGYVNRLIITQPQAQKMLSEDTAKLVDLRNKYIDLIEGRRFTIRVNEIWTESYPQQYEMLQQWWKALAGLFNGHAYFKKEIVLNGSGKNCLVEITCEGVGYSSVKVEGNRDIGPRLFGLLNMAFAASNIPDIKDDEGIASFEPLLTFINERYYKLTGIRDYIPSTYNQETIETKVRTISIPLPPIIREDYDTKIELELALEALKAV